MKNRILTLLGLATAFSACSEADLSGYEADSYIQFEKSAKDSTTYSFAYDKSAESGFVTLKVNCISNLSAERRMFSIRYEAEESTAREGEDFVMPPAEQTVEANDSIAYIKVELKNSPRLEEGDLTLVLSVVDGQDFKAGLTDHRKNRIIFSNRLTRPAWWDDWHESNGLGSYSGKKYETFINVTGINDLTLEEDGGKMDYSTMRAHVLKFKYWLQENPTTDENGGDMKVAMRG